MMNLWRENLRNSQKLGVFLEKWYNGARCKNLSPKGESDV